MSIQEARDRIENARRTNATTLDLSHMQLDELPSTLWSLSNLRDLNLSYNRLAKLPSEIENLTNLTYLELRENMLTSIPVSLCRLIKLSLLSLSQNRLESIPTAIGNLSNLTQLYLQDNQLYTVPLTLWSLKNLSRLSLSRNLLQKIPSEIYQLSKLTHLYLSGLRLRYLPTQIGMLTDLAYLFIRNSQLQSVPSDIGNLINLIDLDLRDNHLDKLPSTFGSLIRLRKLALSRNRLTHLPQNFKLLGNLKILYLNTNRIQIFPNEILHLENLVELDLKYNQISELPPKISRLQNLDEISLRHNALSGLPSTIGQLHQLTKLFLNDNQLRTLPEEIGNLVSLVDLDLYNNPLINIPHSVGNLTNLRFISLDTPPPPPLSPEIAIEDAQSIIKFLHALIKRQPQWISKMLVVGEGGVGKTSLLRALRNEPFDNQESSTHGIDIVPVDLPHPSESGVTMQLKAWDFGGQEIYHATHQFFLTTRSLFLLVWNARGDVDQANLYYWLDIIKSRAPQSPIFIVATHTDERDARIPIVELQQAYPNIVGHHAVSCKTGSGIDNLRMAIQGAAAKLPLMGEFWPKYWLQAANAVRSHSENHLPTAQFFQLLADNSVTDHNAQILAKWLHELGDILYYAEDETINDTVILKPQWVTAHISKVLTSEDVQEKIGILTREEMNHLWADLPPSLRDHFLRIMEQFDLSYRTLDDIEKSLVVERLPLDPADYDGAWNAKQHEMAIMMRYELSTIPAGVPTWFIARQHRFTTKTHWRNGVLFADAGNDKENARHLALVRAYEHSRTLELTVRGPAPYSFFNLLHDGLELTLARFPGLEITRLIPCPDPNREQCDHYFKYENLHRRLERKKLTIECPACFEDIQVTQLIFGIDDKSRDLVLERLDQLDKGVEKVGKGVSQVDKKVSAVSNELKELQTLTQRQFSIQFALEQRFIESHTPSVFVLFPTNTHWLRRPFVGQSFRLDLCCEAPGKWHTLKRDGTQIGSYPLELRREWLTNNLPHLKTMFRVLSLAAPFFAPWFGMARVDLEQEWGHHVDLMEGFLTDATDLLQDDFEFRKGNRFEARDRHATGSMLREIRALLDELDPRQHWGGLRKVLTPEGHYLWLCEEHAKEYLPPAFGASPHGD